VEYNRLIAPQPAELRLDWKDGRLVGNLERCACSWTSGRVAIVLVCRDR
jgi:hypothetical protein